MNPIKPMLAMGMLESSAPIMQHQVRPSTVACGFNAPPEKKAAAGSVKGSYVIECDSAFACSGFYFEKKPGNGIQNQPFYAAVAGRRRKGRR